MSTYAQLQSRIADDLNRADLTTQIAQQILLAITHYKSERLPFNEATTNLVSVASQGFVVAPTGLVRIDHFYITVSGRNIELVPMDLNEIIEYRPTTNGRPRAFCYYQDRFELDRLADQVYSMPIYYVKELTALSIGTDTNGWTTDGEDLIVFRAEKMLYASVIKDTEKAQTAAMMETAALTELRSLSKAKTTTGYAKAYYL